MNDYLTQKIKKYIFFIALIFSFFLGGHLIYLYLYDGATESPVEGGTISEAIIGSFPHFNPLLGSNDHNKYINRLLYRSLLDYDIQEKKFVNDLASCDTTNLLYVECFLENNLKWSDGSDITADDVIATLNLIKKTEVNPGVASLLADTTIEKGEGKIIFTNVKKDINFLGIFEQPILPKSVIDNLNTEMLQGNFSPVGGIYSGRYILASVTQDETVGITKITLEKNPNYFQNNIYIDKIIFRLFTDNNHFLKHKSTVNFFNDKENIVGDSVPRLNSLFYTLPQFASIFLNQETLPKNDIRSFIFSKIEREKIQSVIGNQKVEAALNPYLTQRNIDISSDVSLESIMNKSGYSSKSQLLESKKSELTKPQETIVSQEAQPEKPSIVQENLKVIVSPTTQKYNFISKDNILLRGNTPKGIDAVYINEYKLQGFSSGDTIFYYRLSESYDTLKSGENRYKIYFETGGKKELQEEIVYIYDTDIEAITETEKNYFSAPQEIQKAPQVKPDNDISLKNNLTLADIESMDSKYYYNSEGKPFSLNIVHNNSEPLIIAAAVEIQKELQNAGILVNLTPLSLIDITKGLRENTLQYDGIIIGINLGYFSSNLFPYFHSSQVENGYNFSNYKQLGLDILLEEIKSNNLSNTKREELEEKVLDIFTKDPLFKVIYTPKIRLLVDKSINHFSIPESIPDSVHRIDPLFKSYLTQKKNINFEGKGFFNFVDFLFTRLF